MFGFGKVKKAAITPITSAGERARSFRDKFSEARKQGVFLRRSNLTYADAKLYRKESSVIAVALTAFFFVFAAPSILSGGSHRASVFVMGLMALAFVGISVWAYYVEQKLARKEIVQQRLSDGR